MTPRISVLIADDHAVFRAGLKLLLSSHADVLVVGEAGDAQETLAVARRTEPDVVLMDLSMPGGGAGCIEDLRRACPRAHVLVLTMHDDPAYVRVTLAAGASGYVVKRATDTELLSAIRAVARGCTFLDSTVEEQAAAFLRHPAPRGAVASGSPPSLSAREQQVLGRLAAGHTNRETAEWLGLSVKTVETYKARLARKLGLRTRADFVRHGIEAGLLRRMDLRSRKP